jgi:SAM-dependent methyltransferase
MKETSKTNKFRDQIFFDSYLAGKLIDIGCGEDPVCASAERFDIEDGDANNISKYRPCGAYDTVISSHCLEHMSDVKHALQEWWELVKEGGYLIVVVPDEDMYEQGFWPSIFNTDHKATFRLDKNTSWSPVSFDIRDLIFSLPNATLTSVRRYDQNYDYTLMSNGCKDRPLFRKVIFHFIKCMNSFGSIGVAIGCKVNSFLYRLSCPIDQTLGNALAQIEVIAQKNIR